jgi:hypothetical protein
VTQKPQRTARRRDDLRATSNDSRRQASEHITTRSGPPRNHAAAHRSLATTRDDPVPDR